MFDVGKRYEIRTTDPGFPSDGITCHYCEVIAYEAPLLKLRNYDGKEWIINTAAPQFVSAEKDIITRSNDQLTERIAEFQGKMAQGAS